MKTVWCLAVLAFMTGSALDLGAQEPPFTAAVYKSSHNSYDRDESLARQIDAYNVWQIELDVYDYQGDLKVNHNCDPASISSASTLNFLLQKMVSESVTFRSRYSIVYLDMKGNGKDSCPYGWGLQIGQRLTTAFETILGTPRIYSPSQFIQRDQSRWPSHQELVRRGFNWSVIVDWHGPAPQHANPDNLFFSVAQTDPPDALREPADAVLVNVDGGCDASPTSEAPQIVNNRWLYRIYPGSCGQDCPQLDGAYWENGIARRYNLIATNCIARDHTFQPPVQSPDPLFVAQDASHNCPENDASCEWGTVEFPYHDVAKAIQRASPMTALLIQPGAYAVATVGPLIINRPVILHANGASAVVLK